MDKVFLRFANDTARLAGRPWSFFLCVAVVVVWALTGPLFGFSATWQLIINTGTTIVTFLMVFLIQNTQNRDTEAMHIKLDELIRAALERSSSGETGKQATADDTVDRLLERF